MANPKESDVRSLLSRADRALELKEHKQAEALYRDSLKICSAADTYDPVELVGILHNLALVLEAQQQTEEALRVRQRARWILESLSRAGSSRRALRKQLGELMDLHAESEAALKRLADSFSNRDRNQGGEETGT